ncbi:MAG: hypothetical protein PHT33_15685 [bacterium]|nr:hypothetical protein [bacterium]
MHKIAQIWEQIQGSLFSRLEEIFEEPLIEKTRQLSQTPEDALLETPIRCDVGKKKDAKGNTYKWIGWKAHMDFGDGGCH